VNRIPQKRSKPRQLGLAAKVAGVAIAGEKPKPRVRPIRPGAPRRGPVGTDMERWRNPDYLAYLRRECRCVVCWIEHWETVRNCEASHGPVNGMRSKGPDAEAIPLCNAWARGHHGQQHKLGWPEFERKYRFSREQVAKDHFEAFLKWKEQTCKTN
jgi:hypothetical protein